MKYISAGIFAFAALGTVLGMASFTNKKVKSECMREKSSITGNCLYHKGSAEISLLFGILLLSGVCGYRTGEWSDLTLAGLKIGCCYIAALGAAVTDYKLRIIPNFIPLSLVGIRLLFFVYEWIFLENAMGTFRNSIIGGVCTFLFLTVVNKLSKGGVGAGDNKLLSATAFMSDIHILVNLLIPALVLCAVFSLILLVSKKPIFQRQLPFAPFIYAGAAAMCLLPLQFF